jgi:hypothetical protein
MQRNGINKQTTTLDANQPSFSLKLVTVLLYSAQAVANPGCLGHKFNQYEGVHRLSVKKGPKVGNRSPGHGLFFIQLNDFIDKLHPAAMRQEVFDTDIDSFHLSERKILLIIPQEI